MRLPTLIASCFAAILIGIITLANENHGGGILEGHLKILSSKEVELAGPDNSSSTTTSKTDVQSYGEFPLIILGKNNGKEVTRGTADAKGNYRVELPPGDYVLDVRRGASGRPLGHLRATPQPFTVVLGQAVRVDMDIDMGIR